MQAITGPSEHVLALREEYRIALRLWSEARALYPEDSAEVERATEHVAILEYELKREHGTPAEPLIPALEAQG